MKKLKHLLLAVAVIVGFHSALLAQKRLFTQTASVTDRALYARLQAISAANVDLFHFDPDLIGQEALSFELDGVSIRFDRTEQEESKEGYSWYGRDVAGNSLVLTYRNRQLAGKLYYDARAYTISPYDSGTVAVYRMSSSQLPAVEHPEGQDNRMYIPVPEGARLMGDGVVKLRVLVAYTSAAEAGAATLGYSDMKLFLQQAISETNLTFVNSNVAHRVRLACGVRVSYNESAASWETTVARFQGTSDGYMDEIHAYRNSYSADVCALLVDNSSACGIASSIGSNASTAFCAADYRCILTNNTLGHEIGHLHGCRHNPEVDPATTPYAYGHGYRNDVGGWRTVMSYQCSPSCPRLPYWSNPDIYYFGSAMGTNALHDNARVLDQTAATLAGYRTAPATLTLSSSSSLIDDEYGEAIATSEITMQGNFEVSNNSEFYAYASGEAGSSDYAPFRFAVDKEQRSVLFDPRTQHGVGNDLILYPNPTTSERRIFVRLARTNLNPPELIDSRGRSIPIESKYLSDDQIEINLPSVAPGMYLLKFTDGKSTHIGKLVIHQ